MEKIYTDISGIKHDLDIYTSQLGDDTLYTIHRDGIYFLDLVLDDGVWTEIYGGRTERSEEYGKLLDSIFARSIK